MNWRKSEELTWDRVVVFVDSTGHIGVGEVIINEQTVFVRELVSPEGIHRIVHPYKIKAWMDYHDFEWPEEN
jgi:hypothetical protein